LNLFDKPTLLRMDFWIFKYSSFEDFLKDLRLSLVLFALHPIKINNYLFTEVHTLFMK
jgi:hypothetical protein